MCVRVRLNHIPPPIVSKALWQSAVSPAAPMDFFKANDVLKGLRVSAAPTEAEKTALRRDKLEACKIVVDHLFTSQVMFVHTIRDTGKQTKKRR